MAEIEESPHVAMLPDYHLQNLHRRHRHRDGNGGGDAGKCPRHDRGRDHDHDHDHDGDDRVLRMCPHLLRQPEYHLRTRYHGCSVDMSEDLRKAGQEGIRWFPQLLVTVVI